MRRAALALCALLAASPARAELTAAELARVEARPAAGARLPMQAPFHEAGGRPATLAAAADGEPLILVFADYACTTLCGPAMAITAARLGESGLAPGRDFRLAVIGLDPKATPRQAAAFADARIPPPLLAATTLLVGDPAPAARAAGYGYVWDAAVRAYAHPVAAYVLTPDGRVAGLLSEVAITGPALRDAIVEARGGRVGALIDRVGLVCHGALVAVGRFDAGTLAALRVAGLATLAAFPLGLLWLSRRRRRLA